MQVIFHKIVISATFPDKLFAKIIKIFSNGCRPKVWIHNRSVTIISRTITISNPLFNASRTFSSPFPCWFVRSSLKDKGTKEQVSKEGAWNRNIILVKKESCLSVCLYLHLKRMKLCGIFIAYQRLCVFYFGACTHQQPMSIEGGHLLHSVKKGPYTRKIFLPWSLPLCLFCKVQKIRSDVFNASPSSDDIPLTSCESSIAFLQFYWKCFK